MNPESNKSGQSHSRHTVFASLAAFFSVFAASSCCLPVLPFVFAAGTATGSAILAEFRPYLLAVSVACIAFGFYQARRARQCHAKPRVISTVLLWFSAVVVVMSILFPQVLANLLAG
jgi:hypothetical protein